MTCPTITIGMPIYNCEATIGEAIASILNQTFADWELIVCDDGSTDATADAALGFGDPRIRVLRGGANLGLPARLNQIVAACRSEFFARMDGDDVAYPDRFQKQLQALRANPAVDLIGGSVIIIDRQGNAIGYRRSMETHREICGRPWRFSNLIHVTWMGRAAWFKRNPYDASLTHSQDRALLLRTRNKSRFAALPDTLAGVREDRPVWSKLVRARRQLVRSTTAEALRQRDLGLFVVSPLAETVKLALDAIATSTGLGHRLLRHRVPFVSAPQVEEWQSVLEAVRRTVLSESGCLKTASGQ